MEEVGNLQSLPEGVVYFIAALLPLIISDTLLLFHTVKGQAIFVTQVNVGWLKKWFPQLILDKIQDVIPHQPVRTRK